MVWGYSTLMSVNHPRTDVVLSSRRWRESMESLSGARSPCVCGKDMWRYMVIIRMWVEGCRPRLLGIKSSHCTLPSSLPFSSSTTFIPLRNNIPHTTHQAPLLPLRNNIQHTTHQAHTHTQQLLKMSSSRVESPCWCLPGIQGLAEDNAAVHIA